MPEKSDEVKISLESTEGIGIDLGEPDDAKQATSLSQGKEDDGLHASLALDAPHLPQDIVERLQAAGAEMWRDTDADAEDRLATEYVVPFFFAIMYTSFTLPSSDVDDVQRSVSLYSPLITLHHLSPSPPPPLSLSHSLSLCLSLCM